jgi:DNA repair protein RecN (Recombination protein N)
MFANDHILVKKEVRGKETYARIIKLDNDMRKIEIARMLGGKDITKKTVEHAAEMLQKGKQK